MMPNRSSSVKSQALRVTPSRCLVERGLRHSAARWQATVIEPIVVGAGTSMAQRSIARGQRVRNAHPDIASSGDGGSLGAAASTIRRARPRFGVLAKSACVYGCSGRAKIAYFGPCSTALPRYMTSTASAM
jgi:hypothetical protein